jgi:hypothetical protein
MVTDANGELIPTRAVRFVATLSEPPQAEVEIALMRIDADGVEATLVAPNGKAIRRIEYVDGTFDEFP